MYDSRPLDILPGIFKESSEYAAQGRYTDGSNVRFWKGFPERIGGNTQLADGRAKRPVRGMNSWRSLTNGLYTALGHARGVEILEGGTFTGVSPIGSGGYPIITLTISSIGSGTGTIGAGNIITDGTSGATAKVVTSTSSNGPLLITANDTSSLATWTVTLTGAPTGTFISGEPITFAGGGSARFLFIDSTTLYLYDVDQVHTVTLSGSPSGPFQSGETLNFSGGGSARLTSIDGLVMTVSRVEGTLSGTITGATSMETATYSSDATTLEGVATGSISGATGTYLSDQELWLGTITDGTTSTTASVDSWVESGLVDSGATTEFGGGTFGSSVFGGSEGLYSTVNDATTWTFANWGEDLIACPRGGNIYVLDVSAYAADSTVNMTHITQAPSASGIFLNDANRTLVAYGADGDPLNVAWCDEEDYTIWDPLSTNTAGSVRCENGSVIIGRMDARGGHLISTDTAIYLFRYIGLPFVFSLEQIASQTPLIGPHASAEQDGITYWMGRDGFYFYDGSVNRLPCDVQSYVFGRINVVQSHKINCSGLRAYNEIWWHYVSADSPDEEVDSYVCYNTVEQTWHIGSKARTSQIDSSVVLAYPQGCEADGTINAEEIGTTDNGAAISYTLETSEIEINDGQVFMHTRMLIPDFDRITDTHTVTIETSGYPARTKRSKGPYSVTSSTEKLSVRARGALMRFCFAGSSDFRLGRWRYRITGHGQKGN